VNQASYLTILYDMALTMSRETTVRPLLTRVVQRLLYHTSFPCGVFISRQLGIPGNAGGHTNSGCSGILEMAIGSHALRGRIGASITLDVRLMRGPPQMLEDVAELVVPLFPSTSPPPAYPVCLRLPVPGEGVLLLFASTPPGGALPVAEVFSPVLSNLAKMLHLCRVNEAHTRTLIEEREGEAAARRRFRTALDTSDDAIFLIDPATLHFVDFNRSVADTMGYPAEQLAAMGPLELVPEHQRGYLRTLLRDLAAGGVGVVGHDTEFVRGDGSRFPVEVRWNRSLPQDGPPVIIAVARDVTRRNRTERDLRKSAYLLNRAQRIANTGYCEWNLEHSTITWSEQTFRIFGRSPGEFMPTTEAFAAAIHPEDRKQVLKAVREAARTRQAYICHYRILRPDGEVRYIREQGEPVGEGDATPPRVLSTLQDVSEMRRMEEDLRRSELLLRQVTENIQDMFRLDDLGDGLEGEAQQVGRTIYVSPAYETIWGLPCDTLYRDPLAFLEGVHPEDRSRVATAFAGRIRGEYDQIYRVVRPDGSLRWVRERVFPVRDGMGHVYRVAGVASDITELKAAEQDKENALLELAQTRKLEAVGVLAGGIAHDFNNLLTSISGFAQLALLKVDAGSPLAKDLGAVCDSADRAAGLTRQLLAFSRKQSLTSSAIHLGNRVLGLLDLLQRTLGEDVAVAADIDPAMRLVQGDPVNIDQVLLNLAINARDAMPRGGALRIRVGNLTLGPEEAERRHPDARAGDFVFLEVTDSGVGMDAQTLARVFDPFFTTKGVGSGTGLGLSVVYGVARQHEGWVEVHSQPGEGATFLMLLPALPVGAEADTSLPSRSSRPPQETSGDCRVLVIEDEPSLLQFASLALSGQGYRVTTAASCGEARGALSAGADAFCLVFSDVVLPDGSGIRLAEEIRARHPNLPVLLCSGYPEKDDRWHEVRVSNMPFIAKPYTMETLLHTVARLIRLEDRAAPE